jgi:hypothetical protein
MNRDTQPNTKWYFIALFVLVLLKVTDTIAWHWIIVLLPLWGIPALIGVGMMGMAMFSLIFRK